MNDFDLLGEDSEQAGVLVETMSAATGTAVVVVSLTGEIDMLTEAPLHDGLQRALEQPDIGAVVVDLTEVTFFGSSGIGALAAAHTTAVERGRVLQVVVPPDSATRRPLQLTGMSEVLGIHATLPQALAACPPHDPDSASPDPTTGEDEDPYAFVNHAAP